VSAVAAQRRCDPELDELLRVNAALTETNRQLGATRDQLVQAEKMASIGQLAAGVAHEINNPIGFIFSNFGTLDRYLRDLFKVLAAYEACEPAIGDARARQSLAMLRREVELDYLKQDIPMLMSETREGIDRVRKIVQDLKDFSHVDTNRDWEWADLHKGIESTLNIVNNEIKYKAEVVRQYGDLPPVRCLASELNQVFMNLLVNAAHAITRERGTIVVRTGCIDGKVRIDIEDDGCGIAPEHLPRIFDPFFTTKPVGKGTGLGLSLAYGIVRKHGGLIEVTSEAGRGSRFRVTLPVEPVRDGT
jgi:signal transduction histidine kinase